MTSARPEPVHVDIQGAVMVVTIDRPEARNAIDARVHRGVGEAVRRGDADPAIRAIVLTGAGDMAFSAGADLKAMSAGIPLAPPDPEQEAWGLGGFVRHTVSTPTIAAVNGLALGGGTELALAADLVVAVEHARFGLPEVTRGIFAGAGGAFRLPRQIPQRIALELILTGDTISARRALELGLINRVVESDALAGAVELADRIAANAPLAVQASKRVALGIDGAPGREEADWERNAREFAAVERSDDAREGMLAFVEKRSPRWSGR